MWLGNVFFEFKMEQRDRACNDTEIQEIIDSILVCDKSDYSKVSAIFSRLSKVLEKQNSISQETQDEISAWLLLKKHATPWLVSLLRRVPVDTLDENLFLDDISTLISLLCGKTGLLG